MTDECRFHVIIFIIGDNFESFFTFANVSYILPECRVYIIVTPHFCHFDSDFWGNLHLNRTSHVSVFLTASLVHFSHVSVINPDSVFKHHAPHLFTRLHVSFTVITGYFQTGHIFADISVHPIVSKSVVFFFTITCCVRIDIIAAIISI